MDPRYESVPTTITFDGDLLIAIDQYARRLGISRSQAVRRGMTAFGPVADILNDAVLLGDDEPAAASE